MRRLLRDWLANTATNVAGVGSILLLAWGGVLFERTIQDMVPLWVLIGSLLLILTTVIGFLQALFVSRKG